MVAAAGRAAASGVCAADAVCAVVRVVVATVGSAVYWVVRVHVGALRVVY